jgi:hypothetical protein
LVGRIGRFDPVSVRHGRIFRAKHEVRLSHHDLVEARMSFGHVFFVPQLFQVGRGQRSAAKLHEEGDDARVLGSFRRHGETTNGGHLWIDMPLVLEHGLDDHFMSRKWHE